MGGLVFHRRRTLADKVRLEGRGIITGARARAILHPAPDSGLWLRVGEAEAPVDVDAALQYPNCTGLGVDGKQMFVVEHLLAALHLRRVTELVIEAPQGEVPILDGSAAPIVAALDEAGYAEVEGEVECLAVAEPLFLAQEQKWLAALPYDGLRVTFYLDHPHPLIGRQLADFRAADGGDGIAAARTFATYEEVQHLLQAGYIKGGGEENAVIVYHDRRSSPLRAENEFARHKVLDILGDLYLCGRPVVGHFLGFRTGHAENRRLLRRLLGTGKRAQD